MSINRISRVATNLVVFQLHFNLTNASQWVEERFGVSYPALYNFIIDYFEGFDPSTEEGQLAKVQCDALLHWYNEYVFLTPPFFLMLTYV